MAKRVSRPSDFTSYNKYSKRGDDTGDTSIAKEYRSDEPGKSYKNNRENGDFGLPLSSGMSPQVLYTVRDAAQILEKAPVTIRKEARTKEIGTIKGQGYLFTDQDVLALAASFEDKENNRRHPLDKPSDEISVARALFERVVYLTNVMVEFKKDRDRFLVMFQEIYDQYSLFQEETEKRLKKLERG